LDRHIWNLYGTYTLASEPGKKRRVLHFDPRTLKRLKPEPGERQVDYFDLTLPGFGIRVSYGGRKSWIVLFRCNGTKSRVTLGRFELVPLADAREMAREALREATMGNDPSLKRECDREAPTFNQLVDRYIEDYATPANVPGKRTSGSSKAIWSQRWVGKRRI
jgi:hypothetical protein